jgi:hypothetical protein
MDMSRPNGFIAEDGFETGSVAIVISQEMLHAMGGRSGGGTKNRAHWRSAAGGILLCRLEVT